MRNRQADYPGVIFTASQISVRLELLLGLRQRQEHDAAGELSGKALPHQDGDLPVEAVAIRPLAAPPGADAPAAAEAQRRHRLVGTVLGDDRPGQIAVDALGPEAEEKLEAD